MCGSLWPKSHHVFMQKDGMNKLIKLCTKKSRFFLLVETLSKDVPLRFTIAGRVLCGAARETD